MAYDNKNVGTKPLDRKEKIEMMAKYTTAENVSVYASIYNI